MRKREKNFTKNKINIMDSKMLNPLKNCGNCGETKEVICMPSKEQLIDALYNEYVFLCHDDFDPDEDATPEEYLEMLKEMSYDELVEETSTDDIFSMDEFMSAWG